MFFTRSSAIKEIQRQINAGNHYVRMEKRWYGWVIVHTSTDLNETEEWVDVEKGEK